MRSGQFWQVGHGVQTGVSPWIATQYPAPREPRAPQGSMALNGFQRVVRATREETAVTAQERGDHPLVKANQPAQGRASDG